MSRAFRSTLVLAAGLAVPCALTACGSDSEPTGRAATTESTTLGTSEATATPTTSRTDAPKRRKPAADKRPDKASKAATAKKKDAPKSPASPPAATTTTAPTTTRRTTTQPAPPPAPKPKPKPPPTTSQPPARTITESATLQLVRREGTTFIQTGPVQGTLSGQMELHASLGGPGVTATFYVSLSDGSIQGRGTASVKLAGKVANFDGTATVTGGTGTYEGVSGKGLRFSGTVAADGSQASVRLSGNLRY